MKEHKLGFTEEENLEIFKFFDADDSGTITYDEFLGGVVSFRGGHTTACGGGCVGRGGSSPWAGIGRSSPPWMCGGASTSWNTVINRPGGGHTIGTPGRGHQRAWGGHHRACGGGSTRWMCGVRPPSGSGGNHLKLPTTLASPQPSPPFYSPPYSPPPNSAASSTSAVPSWC